MAGSNGASAIHPALGSVAEFLLVSCKTDMFGCRCSPGMRLVRRYMVLGKLLQLTSKRDTSSANASDASGTASSLGNDELFWGALFRGMDRGGSFLQLQIRQIIVA